MEFNPILKQYMIDIGKIYGIKILFKSKINGGYWVRKDNTIIIGTANNSIYGLTRAVSLFCHEIGHHLNYIEDKYKLYHDDNFLIKAKTNFKSYSLAINYAHRAEVFTEKRGKELAKIWFPKVKYKAYYKSGDKESLAFMYGYFLSFWEK